MSNPTIRHGNKIWKNKNGKLHRDNDLPAVVEINGGKAWCINDQLHRTNGPAVIRFNGDKQWYLKGIEYSREEYNLKMRESKIKLVCIMLRI